MIEELNKQHFKVIREAIRKLECHGCQFSNECKDMEVGFCTELTSWAINNEYSDFVKVAEKSRGCHNCDKQIFTHNFRPSRSCSPCNGKSDLSEWFARTW